MYNTTIFEKKGFFFLYTRYSFKQKCSWEGVTFFLFVETFINWSFTYLRPNRPQQLFYFKEVLILTPSKIYVHGVHRIVQDPRIIIIIIVIICVGLLNMSVGMRKLADFLLRNGKKRQNISLGNSNWYWRHEKSQKKFLV